MKARRGNVRALATIIGVLVAIGGIAITAYFVHGTARRDNLTERNYRALAMASEQVRERIDGWRVAIGTAARGSSETKQAFFCAPESPVGADIRTAAANSAAIVTSSARRDGTRMAIEPDSEHRSIEAYVAYDAACDENASHVADQTEPDKAGTTACPNAKPAQPDAPPSSSRCQRCAPCTPTTCRPIGLPGILADLRPDDALFDAVVVTIGTDAVVLQGTIERDAKLVSELTSPASGPANEPHGTEDAKQIGPATTPTGTRIVTIEGEEYYRFTMPIDVSPFVSSITDAPENVRLHGLVRKTAFDRDTRRIGDRWVLTLVLLLVLAALTWPLLKLWYMGPAERLRGFDVRIMTLAMTVLAGVVTLVIAQTAWQRALQRWLDGRLEEVAVRVADVMDHELAAASETLARAETSQDPTLGAYHDFDLVVAVEPDAKPVQRCSPIRRDGGWQLGQRSTPALQVRDRRYFHDVLAGNLPYRRTVGNAETAFALEIVRSKTTGELQVVLARPPSSGSIAPPADVATVLIGMNASTILDASLPPGFQFAIVDAEGAVQLHSDARRSAIENLLDQADQDQGLAAALATGSTLRPLSIDYGGQGNRAIVRAIPHAPWRVVALRSDAVPEKVNDEIIALWTMMFLAFAGGILVVMLAVQIFDDGYRAEWVWPDRRFPWLYGPTALRLLLTAAVTTAALEAQRGAGRLVLPLAVAAATVAALALSLHKPRAQLGKTTLGLSERYAAWLVALMGTLVSIGLAIAVRDWWSAAAYVALAAVWWPASTKRADTFVRWWQIAIGLTLALSVLVAATTTMPWIWLAAIAILPILVVLALPPDTLTPATPPPRSPAEADATREFVFRVHYASMAFALLVAVAVVPAYAFARDARAYVWTALARYGRTGLSAATDAQVRRVRDRYAADTKPRDAAGLDDRLAAVRTGVIPTAWGRWNETTISGVPSDERHAADTDRLLSSYAMPWLPAFAPPAPELRATMVDPTRSDPPTGDAGTGPTLSRRSCVAVGIAVGVVIVFGYFLVWSIARLVFLLDADRGSGSSGVGPGTLNAWQYTGGGEPALPIARGDRAHMVIDLRLPPTRQTLATAAAWIEADDTTTFVEVDHPVAVFEDLELHRALLEFLETLVRGRKKTIVLTSDVDPLQWTSAREVEWSADDDDTAPSDDGDTKDQKRAGAPPRAEQASALLGRWALLLSEFKRREWHVPPSAGQDQGIAEILAAKYPTLSESAADGIEDARHWTLWRQCTRPEKLALRQLADEGFLNPNAIGVVRHLGERLLVLRDPAWTLMTPSFRDFVRRAAPAELVRAWEREGEASGWAQLRAPLIAVAVIVAVYLVLAEREVVNLSIAVATGVVAFLPIFMRMFGAIGDKKSGSS